MGKVPLQVKAVAQRTMQMLSFPSHKYCLDGVPSHSVALDPLPTVNNSNNNNSLFL